MNCKPGDLAVIVRSARNSALCGRFVTVHYLVPAGVDFRLPDGHLHGPKPPGWWLCEFQRPEYAPTDDHGFRLTRYAPIPDFVLRPIRDPGDDARDEMLRPLPHEVSA